MTVVERFVASRADLSDHERDLLLGWRDVVEGIFEVQSRDGDTLVVENLIDELTYRVYSNMGPSVFQPLKFGGFMIGRIVPVGPEWLMSGDFTAHPKSDRALIHRIACEISMRHPEREGSCTSWQARRHSEALTHLTHQVTSDQIAAEAALDGIYVPRTSLPEHTFERDDVVGRYKNLADVERFFRTLNTELDVRPIRHRLADRVRAHMLLRMLSYYISWHMKQRLAPILFQDNDKPAAAAKRTNPVAPAQRSDEALKKAARKRTDDDTPVRSFTSLLADLATICANTIQPAHDMPAFTKITSPTALQRQAFELLDVSHRLGCV